MLNDKPEVAFFEATGLKIELLYGWHYHDEGASRLSLFTDSDEPQTIDGRAVKIFIDHRARQLTASGVAHDEAQEIAREEAHPFAIREMLNPLTQKGRCLSFLDVDYGRGLESHVHILYIDRERDDLNIALRAHEEFHAIKQILGGVLSLEQHLSSSYGASINFGRIKNAEIAAWCNSVFALHAHGMDPQSVHYAPQFGDAKFRKYFGQAIAIYDKATNSRNQAQGLAQRFARLVGYH